MDGGYADLLESDLVSLVGGETWRDDEGHSHSFDVRGPASRAECLASTWLCDKEHSRGKSYESNKGDNERQEVGRSRTKCLQKQKLDS